MTITEAALRRENNYFNSFDAQIQNVLYNFITKTCKEPWCKINSLRGTYKDMACACDHEVLLQDGSSLLANIRGREIKEEKKAKHYLPNDVGQFFLRVIPDEISKIMNPNHCIGGFHSSTCNCGPDLLLQYWHEQWVIDTIFIANLEIFVGEQLLGKVLKGPWDITNDDGSKGRPFFIISNQPFILQTNQKLIDLNQNRGKVITPAYNDMILI